MPLTSGQPHLDPIKREQAYHSSYNEDPQYNVVGNMAVLPVNTRVRGPAPSLGE